MSLLEDVFLEDEAGEAQELERVIEGDELDERPRTPDSNDDSEKEDEAEEDKRVVDHNAKAKRAVKNPRFTLNPARLTGPRGIQILPEHFKDFKFKGKGHEREDLDCVLKKLEHWAYRLYPKFKFDDCLKKIETLGKKRPVMVHLHKIRTDQFVSEETVQQQDSSGDEAETKDAPEQDEFDRLLQQQIELARATPTPGSVRKETHTPMSNHRSPLVVPKAASSPSISDEQKERMMRNRKLAEERRLARLNQLNNTHNATADTNNDTHNSSAPAAIPERIEVNPETDVNDDVETNDDIDVPVARKQNRTNIIDSDSSDNEGDVLAVNESITVHVHDSVHDTEDSDKENTAVNAMIVECDENAVSTNVPVVINNSETNDEHNVPVARKQNRTNIIDSDSSDNEGDVLAVNESIAVQVHDSVHDTEDSDKENITVNPMIAESDENAVSTNVPVVINNSETNDGDHVPVARKQNRTNIIDSDSSDNEGDVLAVNESIAVQVHNSVHDTEDSDKENTAVNAMIVESDENAISTDVPVINKSSENVKESVTEETKGTGETETHLTDDKITEDGNINTEVTETVTNDEIGKESVIITSTVADKSKDEAENIETQKLMDIDFTEEF